MDAHRKAIIHGSGQSCWRTPPALVEKLRAVFGFQIDLAADAASTVCPVYLGPDQRNTFMQDALVVDWYPLVNNRGFLNPPFSLSELRQLRVAGASKTQTCHLRIEAWAEKAYQESLQGFTTIGVFPYAPQTEWFRQFVMGYQRPEHCGIEGCDCSPSEWAGHAALDYWRIPHRVSFLQPDGSLASNAGVNTCIIHWGPNPGFVGPWVPSGRYWSYR